MISRKRHKDLSPTLDVSSAFDFSIDDPTDLCDAQANLPSSFCAFWSVLVDPKLMSSLRPEYQGSFAAAYCSRRMLHDSLECHLS